MIMWSIVAIAQYWLNGRSSFLATRFILGFLQVSYCGSLRILLKPIVREDLSQISYSTCPISIPSRSVGLADDAAVILLNTLTVTIRLAYFWISNYVSQIVGSFLAVGILQLRGVNGQAGWRYLFLIEGGFTCLVGIISYAVMPPSPTQTRNRFFPNGWFTER